MVLTFPLPLATFFDGLAIQTGTVDLGEALETSETAGGEILSAALGNRLWTLEVTIATRSYGQGAAVKAMLDTLRYPGRSLIARASPLIAPMDDPTGAKLGNAATVLAGVATNNREITINGLPSGYVLTVGDFVSFQYGTNPVRYALHQIVVGGKASAQGSLKVELSSFVAPGFTTGVPLTLVKPVFKAVLVPGSVTPGATGSQRVDGIKFSLVQTFR